MADTSLNRRRLGGVLLCDVVDDDTASWTGPLTADDLEREFEARLLDSSTLAFRVAFSVLRHREDAEDVAQEVFAQAFRRFRQLRDRSRFRAWLVRMTFRRALDRRKADMRRTAREQVPREAADTTVARHPHAGRLPEIWQAIDALPEKLRIVLVLASIDGHDVAEVARLLEIPEGTVKSRLFTARQQLKVELAWTPSTRTRK